MHSQRKLEKFFSEVLLEDRIITTRVPDSYYTNKGKKFPLILVLDGHYLFDPVDGNIRYSNFWDEIPEAIIVGLHQNDNPKQREGDMFIDAFYGLPAEGGEKFYNFIATELLPYLEKRYRISPFKIIAGHGLSATFANFFLFEETALFSGYISLSPDFTVEMAEKLPLFISENKSKIFYYQSVAEFDESTVKKSTKALDTIIQTMKSKKFEYKYDEIPASDHYSLVLHSIPKALYFMFNSYHPINPGDFKKEIAELESGFVKYLEKKYKEMGDNYSVDRPVRINDFQAIEAAIINKELYEELGDLSKLAKKQYPGSILSDYYLGMMYELQGDFRRAEKAYMSGYNGEPIAGISRDDLLIRAEALKDKANEN
jgi:hypothetical protein